MSVVLKGSIVDYTNDNCGGTYRVYDRVSGSGKDLDILAAKKSDVRPACEPCLLWMREQLDHDPDQKKIVDDVLEHNQARKPYRDDAKEEYHKEVKVYNAMVAGLSGELKAKFAAFKKEEHARQLREHTSICERDQAEPQ